MAARADVNICLENYIPLALFAVDPQAIMVGADTPYKTLRDLVGAVKLSQPQAVSTGCKRPAGGSDVLTRS